jgi:hypothetical protein
VMAAAARPTPPGGGAELGPVSHGGSAGHQGQAHGHHDGQDDQHLGADEELHGHQEAEHHPGHHRAAAAAEEQFVEAGHDEGWDEGHAQHEMGVGQADEDEG